MFISMICDWKVVGDAIDAERRFCPGEEAILYVVNEKLADETLSHWGINSRWSVLDIGDGRALIEFCGPRHSLHDWLPRGFLNEAHCQWLAGELLDYESQRWDVSPGAIDLAPEMPSDWAWDDPSFAGAAEDAAPGDGKKAPRRYGQLFKPGAFACGF